MDNNITGLGTVRAYNPYLLETLESNEETNNEENTQESNAESSSESGSSDNISSKEKLTIYKDQIINIYNSSITKNSSIPNNVQSLITKMKSSYCNTDIVSLDVEKSKKEINALLTEFYAGIENMSVEASKQAISKMSSAIQYTKSHTDLWLKAKLIKDESNDSITTADYTQKRKDFDEFFTSVLSDFSTALTEITKAQYKDPININPENSTDLNNIPTDYSNTLSLLKNALGSDADAILNYTNCSKPSELKANIKKIQTKINDLITKDYNKFFNGESTNSVKTLASNIIEYADSAVSADDDCSTIMDNIKNEVSSFNSLIGNLSIEDKIKAVNDLQSGLASAQNLIKLNLEKEYEGNNYSRYDERYYTEKDKMDAKIKEYSKAFSELQKELNMGQYSEQLTQEIRELNYLNSLYAIPTNVSQKQMENLKTSIATFNSNPTDDNYYAMSMTASTVDKENIDYQEEIDNDLEQMFTILSKTIGDGNTHESYDTEYDGSGITVNDVTYNSGLATTPSTPGSAARDKIREDILSIKNRGVFEDVEVATLLQRELKAINIAQNLELKKFEEEYYNLGNPDEDIDSLKQLYKDLEDAEKEYKEAIESYSQNLYTSPTITGKWSGEAVSGYLTGTTENTIDYDKLKTVYENKISTIKNKIEKAKDKYDYEVKRMKDVFEYETRDIIDTLNTLGIVTTMNYNL